MIIRTGTSQPMDTASIKESLRAAKNFLTPSLNKELLLNGRGFSSMGGLEDFTSLVTLHLESNCIESIRGVSSLKTLKKLYISGNSLSDLGTELTDLSLDVLDVSSNPRLKSLEGLPYTLTILNASGCPRLESVSVIPGIRSACPYLNTLDLSRTGIPLSSLDDLFKMTSLKIMYLKGSPVSAVADFRRQLISNLPKLSYLDDAAVDDLERVGAEAWKKGGKEAEKEARLAFRSEAKAQQRASMKAFALERAQRKLLRELNSSAAGREMSEDEMKAMIDRASVGIMEGQKTGNQGCIETLMATLSSCIIQGDQAECLVCSEGIESGSKAISLPCSHIFHENCIQQWFSQSSTNKSMRSCPTCRAQLDTPLLVVNSPTERQPVTTKRMLESLAASLGVSVMPKEVKVEAQQHEERSSAPAVAPEQSQDEAASSSSSAKPYYAKPKPFVADRSSLPNLSEWELLKRERRERTLARQQEK
jgi:dynein assembly factor 1